MPYTTQELEEGRTAALEQMRRHELTKRAEDEAMKARIAADMQAHIYRPTPPAPSPTLSTGLERLQKSTAFAGDLTDRVAKVADILCGVMPRTGSEVVNRDGTYAAVPVLHGHVDDLGVVLARLASELDRIERGLS